jgi:hypothetical protein
MWILNESEWRISFQFWSICLVETKYDVKDWTETCGQCDYNLFCIDYPELPVLLVLCPKICFKYKISVKIFELKEIPLRSLTDSFYWSHLFYCVHILIGCGWWQSSAIMVGIHGEIHINKCLFWRIHFFISFKNCWDVFLNLNKKYLNVMSLWLSSAEDYVLWYGGVAPLISNVGPTCMRWLKGLTWRLRA